MRPSHLLAVFCVTCLLVSEAAGEDIVEFLSGAKRRGTVVEIRKQKKEIVFESKIGGRKFQSVYPYRKIHAVLYNGKRFVLTKKATPSESGKPVLRTKSQVLELIAEQGGSKPDWYDSTELDYPETLDLKWPKQPSKPWNNKKNIGQYLWDIIYPNPGRWHAGIRLIHHLNDLEETGRNTRAVETLGSMYFNLLQDYPRAAFWWQQANVKPPTTASVGLAECYWRLGNKRMAKDLLEGRRFRIESIKLLGDMGETKRALQLTEIYVKGAKEPQWALLAGGDACRSAGRYQEAIKYYRRVLDTENMKNESYNNRIRARAQQSIDAINHFQLLDISKIPDGSYDAQSMGYEGLVEVSVKVQSGKIEDVKVTRHKEKQFYAALRDIPAQITKKQSVKGIDATSRATITADAIVSATAKALSER